MELIRYEDTNSQPVFRKPTDRRKELRVYYRVLFDSSALLIILNQVPALVYRSLLIDAKICIRCSRGF